MLMIYSLSLFPRTRNGIRFSDGKLEALTLNARWRLRSWRVQKLQKNRTAMRRNLFCAHRIHDLLGGIREV
jgi:hypothetical protein